MLTCALGVLTGFGVEFGTLVASTMAKGSRVGTPRRPARTCASPRARPQSVRSPPMSGAMVCSHACVSSGTASATRPARVYAEPRAAAILGK